MSSPSRTTPTFSSPLLPHLLPQAGEITTPEKGKVFYLSQRPYLVTGTLRDQILYPNPPR